MAPTNTMNLSKETNASKITQDESVPRLRSWVHTQNTIKTEKQERRKMCPSHLKEQYGLQRSAGFFADTSQIYYRKPIKSLARLWAWEG